MPLDAYFNGKGAKVLAAMKKQYGSTKGKQVFYATLNKGKGKKHGKRQHGS